MMAQFVALGNDLGLIDTSYRSQYIEKTLPKATKFFRHLSDQE
jgi:hypothetical protein